MVRINTNRILLIAEESGLWVVAIGSAFLSGVAILGFYPGYWIEFAQAVFLLAFPMTLVGLLSVRSARLIREGEGEGEALWRRLRIHRMLTQLIGMVSIFVTALWGMYMNLTVLPF
ncbi:MAG: component of SufBCD complex, partial [Mameliella sp.]|nr:component of SufBCD complex [Mameliella sp.]